MKGHKTGGRKKGTPNKTTLQVKEALERAFHGIGGVPKLVAWGQENPGEFYRLWARLLPQEVRGAVGVNYSIAERLDAAIKQVEREQAERQRVQTE